MSRLFHNFKAGETVFCQGEPGNCAYIIEAGRIQISINKSGEEFVLNSLGEGEIFGEMAIIDRLPRSATATCLEPSRVCVISRESLVERMEDADPVVRLLMLMFIKRTREMNLVLSRSSLSKSDTGPVPFADANVGRLALDAVRLESEVKQAFDNREFRMHYQPIVELKGGKVVGYEALIRWYSPTKGMVSPDVFMGAIEDSAMINPVGRWIIEQCMNDMNHLQEQHNKPIFICINISPLQFLDPNFVKHLEGVRTQCGLEAKRVKLEITEKALVQGAVAIGVIEKCRQLGYKISLDDFGTGYSSISYLKDIPLDILKVDQSFIRSILTDSKAKNITQTLLSLAQAFGLECVAEGIESEAIAQALQSMGFVHGQGYHFGKPLALNAYTNNKAAKAA